MNHRIKSVRSEEAQRDEMLVERFSAQEQGVCSQCSAP